MEYKIDDKGLKASQFIEFVNKVWPGNYDISKTQDALSKTLNMGFSYVVENGVPCFVRHMAEEIFFLYLCGKDGL